MAKVIRDKWDIGTTAIKGQLIGNRIQLADNSWKTVEDWFIDFATGMIVVEFVEDAPEDRPSEFTLKSKFIVEIDDSIKPLKNAKYREHKK